MASEVAQPQPSHLDVVTPNHSQDAPLTNGDHEAAATHADKTNADAFQENAALSRAETILDTSEKHVPDPNPAGPTPTEDVAPGIAPVSDFLPKKVSTSHPTPPPDEPLGTSELRADAPMSDANDAPQTLSESAAVPTESSLVRPRDDDADDEEPAPKRGKFDSDPEPDQTMEDAPLATELPVAVEEGQTFEESALPAANTDITIPDAKPLLSGDSNAPGTTDTSVLTIQPAVEDAKPSADGQASEIAAAQIAQPAASTAKVAYSTTPLTPLQTKFLLEKMKNLKKTKHAINFLNPVDAVALGIPTYHDIIKNPMDLSTMEGKLKGGQYGSVQGFADDFDLIMQNTRTFNGDVHAVTQAGFSMEAYFRKMMESVPNPGQAVPPKPVARASPAAQKPAAPARRESRSAHATVLPPAAASVRAAANASDTYALQPDGTPQIRRDSSINRPSRAIKPPQNRELTYAKPKRKEHQLELRFCKWVLDEIRSPRLSHLNSVFLAPVDPVALNIPNYRQIVKHPMDLSTMAQKLTSGQYGKASEFKKDLDLMISNCLAFNPQGNPVRDMGIGFQREFNQLWAEKDQWEANQKGESQRATSGSGDDEDSGEEQDDEEEADAETMRALQKQLSELQNTMAALAANKSKKSKKPKNKPSSKKVGAITAAPKQKSQAPKPKAKKPKQVTYEEKQEISEAVGKMNESQIAKITHIITSNCQKYADQQEMELEIDDLPNHVQVLLLKYVRDVFGHPPKDVRAGSPDDLAAMDDDDFEPAERGGRRGGVGGGGGHGGGNSKRKKHKPMGKKEQQETMANIQKQLAQFNGTSGSESPTTSNFAMAGQNVDTSGDEDSDESEEE